MSQSQLSQINIYPVKSIAGISLSNAWVERQGLSFDRRFMLALADGSMVTARKYPQMVKVQASLISDGVVFTFPTKEPLRIRYQDFKLQPTSATVWKDQFEAYTTIDEADDWFTEVIGQRVELLYCGEQSNRIREKLGHNVSFADGYPLLIISQASLDELNKRSPELHTMDQFRTNLVVSGDEPFIEDSWKRIKIGEVEFEAIKPCERCILTTVDVKKGEFRSSKEPLNTLSQFRANERGGVFFGQNLVAKNEGMIRAGDKVEVLEYKDKEFYPDTWQPSLKLTCVARDKMASDFETFWFEPSQGGIPSYKPGQHLPFEVEIDGEMVARRYTISSSPTKLGRLSISVKRVNGGKVSNWLLDHLQVGDEIVAQNPDGNFYLSDNTLHHPLLLLSAGSGVTPMLSMLRYLADNNQVNDVVFYHQCSTEDDLPVMEELDQYSEQFPGLKVIFALSQPSRNWQGIEGRLSVSQLSKVENLNARQAFVCGPNGFMESAKKMLIGLGLDPQHYHQESFNVISEVDNEVKTLQLSVNGNVFTGDNQSSLLEQAEKAGIPISNSCRAGFCGACKVTVESGQVEQPDVPALLDDERAGGKALACCCIPQTDLEVIN
ncbi:hybrid-cluster NAD(P)-dependent oxidoreductase [Vibrio maerlii]|uniref:hybrid-cluster NAD(P)-dependent oxidoreductase n=1 Tax=Vibrio maerlii TaxID=2231648 RepID=UPI000E3E46B9|nr:hybrid-cluster NAD(P)-dependent oxidoreductase [Vibrio maerlii]